MLSRRFGIGLAVFFALLLTVLLFNGVPGLSAENTGKSTVTPAEAQYKEDFNGDGVINITDVIALLLYQRANPGDSKGDYNGDGTPNITDAIALLLAQRAGTLTPIEEQPPAPGDTVVVQGITMVFIPGGTFQMGRENGYSNEKPVHSVTLSALQMGRYEITVDEYQRVTGGATLYFKRKPVVSKSWYSAVEFCNQLSEAAGLEPCYDLSTWECDFTRNGFRLPTEAEWEYACRAGTTTKYYTGDSESDLDRAGWYSSNSGNDSHVVGGKEPNAFGLYDMHGNVVEWCNDWYSYYSSESQTDPAGPESGSYRIHRGGSWYGSDEYCLSTIRLSYSPNVGHDFLGFRVARSGWTVPDPTYSLQGSVLENGSGLAVVTVCITGNGVEKTVTTGSDGSYRVPGLLDGTYTVTPAKIGYTFSPASVEVTISGSDVAVENIAATAGGPCPSPGDTTVIRGITMVSITGGTFQMGQVGVAEPVHTVTLSAFQMSRTEITQAQYSAVAWLGPYYFIGDCQPVNQSTWYSAVKFCIALSDSAGLDPCYNIETLECDFSKNGFRLPTEAEWEYACRAGTTTNYYTGDSESDLDRAGWYKGNSIDSIHTAGGKEANAFGLYDMHGNVREWCNDWYGGYSSESQTDPAGPGTGYTLVIRGGNYKSDANECRSAHRDSYYQMRGTLGLGFRVVRGGEAAPDPDTHSLQGSVLENGSGLAGVIVRITGNGFEKTIATGSDGSYRVSGLSDGAYTVTPTKIGYTFSPVSLDVTISGSDITVEDITAAAGGPGPSPGDTIVIQSITMVFIPGGTFQMGSNDTSNTWLDHSRPVHTVTLDSFQISRTEITQAQYNAVKGANPSYFTGDDSRPVEQVGWYYAVTFCNRLSEMVGLEPCYNLRTWECNFTRNGFRLPTEAEWEYSCRAGTTTMFYTGDTDSDLDRAGWYYSNSGSTTHAAGGKEANAYGLYDMHGNVWEWCNDRWQNYYNDRSENDPTGPESGNQRVLRGGSWGNAAQYCRSAYRYYKAEGNEIGFRVVRR